MIHIDVLMMKGCVVIPSIGEKIKLLRKAKAMTQAELAEIILSNSAKVSRVENGDEEYSQEELEAIREHFKMAEMPLTEFERAAFKEGLYFWRELIIDRKIDEAKDFRDKKSFAVELELFDPDLSFLYRLFDIMLLLNDRDIVAAEEKMSYLRGVINDMNAEHLYFYYSNHGLLSVTRDFDYKAALEFYEKARELKKSHNNILQGSDEKLYFDMATCHTQLEFPFCAIMLLDKIPEIYVERRTERFKSSLGARYAVNYIKIGKLKEAEEILSKCLVKAKGIDDKLFTGAALHNLGLLYKQSKEWGKAIEHLDQALSIFEIGADYHLWTLYHKIHCLIGAKDFLEAEKMIKQARAAYGTNNANLIPFESINHYLIICKRMTLYNEKSVEYIENVTIPYLIKQHDNFLAIGYYALLEQHYKKTRKNVKSLLMSKAIRDIYEKVFIQP